MNSIPIGIRETAFAKMLTQVMSASQAIRNSNPNAGGGPGGLTQKQIECAQEQNEEAEVDDAA